MDAPRAGDTGAPRHIQVRTAERSPAGWDAFVRRQDGSTPFHLTAWTRCVESGLGHRAVWIWAEDGGEIAGVFPLSHVRSRLFGNRLCASPQAAYGGPLASDAAVRDALLAGAEAEAERRGVGHLEVRFAADPGASTPSAPAGRWHGTDLYVTIGGTLADDDDGILAAIPKKTRADCRKADDRLVASESAAHFDAFFALFSENQRDLGTPVLPRSFLAAVVASPDLGARVLVVRDGTAPVAACLSLTFADRVLPYWAGASAAHLHLHPNHALYLNVLRGARRDGFRTFDFGRSKRGSGSYEFKKRWGFGERSLHYRYRLVRALAPPRLNPSDARWRRRIEAWKRLPLPVANALGPLLSPGLS